MRALDVGVRAAGRWLVREVSLHVPAGRVCALVGPNGAGKSTLLRAMAGELRTAEGAVFVGGVRLADHEPLALARRRAVLPQHASLSFPFEVREVVEMGRRPFAGLHGAAHERRVLDEVVSSLDLAPLLGRRYPSLSGGERQRVQAGRVLAQVLDATPEQPRWLLLDEPTAAFDLPRVGQLFEAISRPVRDGSLGVLVVVHDLTIAATFADDVALLQGGGLVLHGHARQVLTPEHLEPVFGTRLITLEPEPGRQVVVPLWAAGMPRRGGTEHG